MVCGVGGAGDLALAATLFGDPARNYATHGFFRRFWLFVASRTRRSVAALVDGRYAYRVLFALLDRHVAAGGRLAADHFFCCWFCLGAMAPRMGWAGARAVSALIAGGVA